MPSENSTPSLKERALEELRIYWIIVVYLALVFGAFATYRRLILSEYGISYLHYGSAVIEALILAKVILIGQALGIGKRQETKPLIWTVLVKSILFGVFAALFSVLEHVVEGLIHHKTWDEIGQRLVSAGRTEILARTLILIVTFIPFFAFWEVGRVLGKGSLWALFFQRRAA